MPRAAPAELSDLLGKLRDGLHVIAENGQTQVTRKKKLSLRRIG